MSEPRRTYRFGPVERRGFLGPVRVGQAAIVIAGLIVAFVLLGADPSPGHAAGAALSLAVSVVFATVPVAGRTAEEWLPVTGAWLARRLVGAHRFHAEAPTAGSAVGRHESLHRTDESLPRALAGVQIVELPYRGHPVGGVSQRGGRWLTAVLACRVMSFSLLDAVAQERNLSQWGSVLSGCADTPVRRVQWLERTLPAEGDQLASWLASQRDPRVPVRGESMLESYLELIDRTARVSQEHEVLIAVQVDASRVRGRGRDATAAVLVQETERIADGLRRAGAHIQGALTARHLAVLFRTAFDPFARVEASRTADAYRDELALAAGAAWPVAAIEGWDHYRTDGAVHTTYWISGWPRVEVDAMFLDPLLAHAAAVRTIAVTFEPTATDRSIRDVESQVTRDQADRALRARFGQAETARDQQAYGATRRRESELAAGYNEVRFAGFITVTAPDLNQLHNAAAEVKRDAARSRLELRPMYAQQAEAVTFTLPLCRGLR